VTQAAVGAQTVAALAQVRVDIAFIGTNGLSLTHGLSTPDSDEAEVKRALIQSARRTVLLADASKFDREFTVRFAELSDVDVIVTDPSAPPRMIAELERHGIEVIVA
jgi:DeoR family fructose operon transcriptional repressor